MKAFQFQEWLQPARLVDVPVPEPGPGEVLIKIGGAGVCHSDLHIMHYWSPDARPELADWALPFTLGHENAGWIEAGDSGDLEKGMPVVVAPGWNCGACRPCQRGPTSAYSTWPPSSCPTGSRFRAVKNSPSHPANRNG